MNYRFLLFTILISFITVVFYKATHAFFTSNQIISGNTITTVSLSPAPTISLTSTPSPTPIPVSPGDVVINEIMWQGSDDEWIELRNTTGNSIDISQWTIENAGSGSNSIQIPPSTTLPAGGLYLIAENKNMSTINVDPDQTTASVSLLDTGEVLMLKTSTSQTIDTAFTGVGWFLSSSSPRKTVERNSTPGDGTQAANWQTATTHTGMDGSGSTDEFGTPKNTNGL